MKKLITVIFTAALLLGLCCAAWAAQPVESRAQYRRNLAYNKNVLPAGWRFEAGYNLWRAKRKLPANTRTYKLYKRDRVWHNNMRNRNWLQGVLLETTDWTVEELALFWQLNQDLLKFHPAGIE